MILENNKEIAESVENGSYYTQAREWYDVVYLNALSDRVYFLMISVIALLICLFVVFSWQSLLPLKEPAPFIYSNQNVDEFYPSIFTLRQQDKSFDRVVQEYLLRAYVYHRESYAYDDIRKNQLFVRNYSAQNVLQQYNRSIDLNNLRSPIVQYQRGRTREIRPMMPQFFPVQEGSASMMARIPFVASVTGGQNISDSSWVATVEYIYLPLNPEQNEIVDGKAGGIALDVKNTEFKILRYDVQETLVNEAAR